jgi:splicing factor 3B subunit 2
MLPDCYADTGIATQSNTIKEKESKQSLRQKNRERVHPKMAKIDFDYQKLHNAFFKLQVPPLMTKFCEMLSVKTLWGEKYTALFDKHT